MKKHADELFDNMRSFGELMKMVLERTGFPWIVSLGKLFSG
jgi:hypothetical protein